MNSTKKTHEKAKQMMPRTEPNRSPRSIVNVAFDVSSETLDWAMKLSGKTITGHCENSSPEIRKTLTDLRDQVKQSGDEQIRVICESTGIYHRRLLQIAGQLKLQTNLVHGEAVAKYRAIQFADHGKTDRRDPKAALTVAKVGKLVKHRRLKRQYAQLRELHRLVLRCEARLKTGKCELHSDLRSLFPDLRLDKSVLYGSTGRVLVEQFGANPYAILDAGKEQFAAEMKHGSKYIKTATIDKIWKAAVQFSQSRQDETALLIAEIQAEGVRQLYTEIMGFKGQQAGIERRMQELYRQLQSTDPNLPSPQKGIVSLRLLSRLVAEIGPPDDFRTINQLMRYAGLNLCERQSGKWRGRTTISRRGRSELRYVLNLMAIAVVSRKRLFSEYYHRKKETDKMPGQKALTCVMRKLLKMFYGWYRSGRPFDVDRVFVMASQHGTTT